MRPSKGAIAVLVVCAVAIALTHRRLSHAFPWRYPAVNELVVTEHYIQDVGALLIGARRLAADVAYIQFLQYYGVSENAGHSHEDDDGVAEHEHYDGDGHDHGAEADGKGSLIERMRRHDISAGNYPRLLELATRFLRLDPYFNGVVLEAAGALAFNQKRVDESLALLREGIQRDPAFFRYHLYVSAILFREKGDEAGLVNLLMEAIKYPDCPPMVEMILGNVLKQQGRYLEAARVYLHTYTTAAKEHERNDALRRLKSVIAAAPDVARQIAAELPPE